jgi:NAD(P)-dependent dehydrogenase (short-subunit alcohol dehydrogenase family)
MVFKNILITGAAKRVGRELAIYFAKKNYNIIIHYNNSKEDAEKLKTELSIIGVKSAIIKADLAIESEACSLVEDASKFFGNIDVLINNASVFENDYYTDVMGEKWQNHMQVNLRSPLAIISDFSKQQIRSGVVINILDYCVLNMPKDNFFSYGLSRIAMWEATKLLALKLAPKIRINAVAPGPTLVNPKQNADLFEQSVRANPLKYKSEVIEICQAVDYFINSPSVTGQIISPDGGRHLSGESYF